ncbi:stage VI sporulation protein F [Bacillus kexueae]|uniref:stage VI sporulation protein F n=1 Tax=Aeribacillus kexueae TaxID=2078952 RepID=UPI001FAFD3D2|nr:stage VI sporulation protein F [Bacillus kexueae]
MDNKFFKNIEKKTGVSMNDVFELANSLQNANFKDEATVRSVVKRVSQMANKKVPKELEDKIVQSIVGGKEKMDIGTISKMLNDNKKK